MTAPPNQAITFRPATTEDAPVVARMLLSLFLHCKRSASDPFISNHTPRSVEELEVWATSHVDSERDILLVAEVYGAVIGFAKGHISDPYLVSSLAPQIGHIGMLWVDPSHREHGIAGQLLAEMEKVFRERGMRFVDVAYLVGNEEAEHFWPEHGYELYRKFAVKELPSI